MNILILGGAGFFGSSLARRCVRDGDNHVLVVDSLDEDIGSQKEDLADIWSKIEFAQGDIRDSDLVQDLVKGQDVVFNCAAQTSHTRSLADPIYDAEINCLGNLNVLEAVRHRNPDAVVVYPSTSTVIGKATAEIINENHLERPLDIYSAHKNAAEKHIHIYNTSHGLKSVVLRFANLYGPYGKPYPAFGFLNYFLHLVETEQDITVYGTGGQKRNVMYVEDAADIMYSAAMDQRLYGGLYFATHEEHYTVSEIAHEIVRIYERGQVVSIDWPEERKRIEIDSVTFSSDQLRDITGWTPRFSFAEGLTKTKEIWLEKSGL